LHFLFKCRDGLKVGTFNNIPNERKDDHAYLEKEFHQENHSRKNSQ
jgi:hypothetical protein